MRSALLWLEGPLQAWDDSSRYKTRATLPFPTRSGILGLVACACGRGGPQEEWLAGWMGGRQEIVSYRRGTAPHPVLVDYQVCGNGYDPDIHWQDMMIPRTADGSKGSTRSRISHRHYLQSAFFACALELPESLEAEAVGGLLSPVWGISLGRKCCVPTDLVFRGVYGSMGEALEAADLIAAGKREERQRELSRAFRVADGYDAAGRPWLLHDVPLSFGREKRYADRYVTIFDCIPAPADIPEDETA